MAVHPLSIASLRLSDARWLQQGTPASPEEVRLRLLPSGPDRVHSSPPRRTLPSTPRGAVSPKGPDLEGEFDPATAGCGYRAPLAPHLARPPGFYPDWRSTVKRARASSSGFRVGLVGAGVPSLMSERGTASASEQPPDFEASAAQYKAQAAGLDRELRIKVSARQTTTDGDLRLAARTVLAANRVHQELKGARDHLLRQAIGARMLKLTDRIEHHDLERARKTLAAIERAYVARTLIHASREQALHVSRTVAVAVEEVANESIKALRLLEYAISALIVTYQRDAVSAFRLWRRVEQAITRELGDLRQPLLGCSPLQVRSRPWHGSLRRSAQRNAT